MTLKIQYVDVDVNVIVNVDVIVNVNAKYQIQRCASISGYSDRKDKDQGERNN